MGIKNKMLLLDFFNQNHPRTTRNVIKKNSRSPLPHPLIGLNNAAFLKKINYDSVRNINYIYIKKKYNHTTALFIK